MTLGEPRPAAPAYFLSLGDGRYRPTAQAGGAWSPDEQHVGPLVGLLVHAVEQFVASAAAASEAPAARKAIARVSVDIFGATPLADVEVAVEVVRPGRTIEMIEASAAVAGRRVVSARVWRLVTMPTGEVAGGEAARLPAPRSLPTWPLTEVWPGGYIASLDVRPVRPPQPGRTTAWISTAVELVAGGAVSDLARFCALIDVANGIAVRRPPTEWLFANVDLTIHFHRQPRGAFAGLDTTVVFGPDGHGVTSTVLHDEAGPVGTAEQILTVRPLR